jgi:hypothetical protein
MRVSGPGAVPTKQQLVQELDGLGYGARMRRMALLGRDAAGTPELAALLGQLMAGDAFEAGLALQAASADPPRAEPLVLEALRHDSVGVREWAARLAGRLVLDDAALEREVLRAAPRIRKLLLKGLAHAGQPALAAALLPLVLARWGGVEARTLLPGCGADTVQQGLSALGQEALRGFRTLARRHPDAVLAFVRQQLEAAPERERPGLWRRFDPLLSLLAGVRTRPVLELALDFPLPAGLPGCVETHLGRFCLRHPELAFELLTRPAMRPQLGATGLPGGALKYLRSFSSEQIARLARVLAEKPHHLAGLLEALAPSARAEVFAHAFPASALEGRLLPEALLAALPHALRDREAARILGLREIREDAERTLAITALRDIDAAREPLQEAAAAASAEDRARALSLLVACTGRSRRGMTETLAFAARIRNEQDPVRLAVLDALAAAPPSAYAEEHIPALGRLVQAAAEARDTSPGTRYAAQRLAFALLTRHAARPQGAFFRFALDVLRTLAAQAGSLSLPSLESGLPRGVENHIVEALAPAIRAAEKTERHQLVLTLARALGRRGQQLEPLQALLEPVLEAVPDYLARQAMELWLAAPGTRDARVRRLLDRDPSVVVVPEVLEHLLRRRQEWLDPFLDGTAVRGRFLTGKTVYLLPVRSGLARWLPRQQRAYALLLERVADDAAQSAAARAAALRTLGGIPAVEAARLERYTTHAEVPVAEAALAALAWLDRQERTLPVLLQFLDGDRARAAMYAASRSLRFQQPERLAAVLAELLGREKLKVTVHKEAVRWLGEYRSEQSLPLLLQEWRRPGLHRDVRIAAGHAARRLLDHDEAWQILQALAASPERDLAFSVLDQRPEELVPARRGRYAGLVLLLCRHPELEVRKRAFGAAGAWSSGTEEAIADAAAERVLDLEHGAEWAEATDALLQACRDGQAPDELLRVVRGLRSAHVPEAMDATRERDVPARQRLAFLCGRLEALPGASRIHLDPLLQTLAEALFEDPTLQRQAVRLAIAGLRWKLPSGAAERLLALAARDPDEPLFGWQLAEAVCSALAQPATEWEAEAAVAIVDGLGASPWPAAQLMAVRILGAAGERLAWPEDCAERLRLLRRHQHVAVRTAALDLWTASETAGLKGLAGLRWRR